MLYQDFSVFKAECLHDTLYPYPCFFHFSMQLFNEMVWKLIQFPKHKQSWESQHTPEMPLSQEIRPHCGITKGSWLLIIRETKSFMPFSVQVMTAQSHRARLSSVCLPIMFARSPQAGSVQIRVGTIASSVFFELSWLLLMNKHSEIVLLIGSFLLSCCFKCLQAQFCWILMSTPMNMSFTKMLPFSKQTLYFHQPKISRNCHRLQMVLSKKPFPKLQEWPARTIPCCVILFFSSSASEITSSPLMLLWWRKRWRMMWLSESDMSICADSFWIKKTDTLKLSLDLSKSFTGDHPKTIQAFEAYPWNCPKHIRF